MHKPNQNIESCESVESSICDELSSATNTECVTDLKIKDEQIIDEVKSLKTQTPDKQF